ncbi:winged helix-turn-helix domain-containing protein [Shewanella sp. UCD-KL12]|uniref:winged helix-turn-helix domain-containing protein n=1 Tax=Shewanella sp. UCD-KL12 TaxID=1917163 RepID=UPI000970E1DB|nr:winged helix-turn-helix domain-containing protein [Shewanella sp. UCD-KL12]
MSQVYKSAGFDILPLEGKVFFQGVTVKIRPKTFQLLMLLIETQGEVVSKSTILSHVWDDVVVDEQVIFQSIKELRKAFSVADVIKTLPRKGYVWVAQVECINSDKDSEPRRADKPGQNRQDDTLANQARTAEQHAPSKRALSLNVMLNKVKAHRKSLVLAMTVTILLVAALLNLTIFTEPKLPALAGQPLAELDKPLVNSQSLTGAVVILPIQNQVSDTHQKWVRYGAMDQLIHQLKPTEHYGVLQADDVLEVMKRADMPLIELSHQRADIDRLFTVSGASLIADIKLTGTPGDYQFIYSLHTKDNIKRGVLVHSQIELVINEMAGVINQHLGQTQQRAPFEYHTSFANQMLASAFEFLHRGDELSAEKLLKSALVSESDNLAARRLLAQVLVHTRQTELAANELTSSIDLARRKANQFELARLRFLSGVNAQHNQQFDESIAILEQAKEDAESVKDWLYLGYIHEAMGRAYQSKGRYAKAEGHYQLAMEKHQIIQCPYGLSVGLLNLSELSVLQGDLNAASNLVERSLSLINTRELNSIKPLAENLALKISQMGDAEHRL